MDSKQASGDGRAKGKALIVVVVVLFLGVAYVAYRFYLNTLVQAELEAVRQAGYPVTLQELDAWYEEPPPGQNAADIYGEAFAKYVEPGKELKERLPLVGNAELPARGEPLPEDMTNAIAERLDQNKEALELLHRAAAMKHCRYPVDLTDGFAALMPHLPELRPAARLLALEGIIYAEEGNPEAATRSVLSSIALARSLENEPTLISCLVRFALLAIGTDSLERVMCSTSLTDGQLEDIAAALADAEVPRAFARGMAAERCTGSDAFGMDAEALSAIDGPLPRWLMWTYKATGLWQLDHLVLLAIFGDTVQGALKPLPERIRALDGVDAKLVTLSEHKWRYPLTMRLMPAMARASHADGRSAGQLRSARVAIALERYRLANGRLPEELPELVPTYLEAIPADPFDGKPIRYMRPAKGYVTYSVGDDCEDNGGAEVNEKGQKYEEGTDITFTVAR